MVNCSSFLVTERSVPVTRCYWGLVTPCRPTINNILLYSRVDEVINSIHSNRFIVVTIAVSVFGGVLITVAVILLIMFIKQRADNKRSYISFAPFYIVITMILSWTPLNYALSILDILVYLLIPHLTSN